MATQWALHEKGNERPCFWAPHEKGNEWVCGGCCMHEKGCRRSVHMRMHVIVYVAIIIILLVWACGA